MTSRIRPAAGPYRDELDKASCWTKYPLNLA
nr:MAG TPA: hypothetical protein [Caudoviricetes sp.]